MKRPPVPGGATNMQKWKPSPTVVFLVIVVAFLTVLLFGKAMIGADKTAEDRASFRVLSDVHHSFMNKHGLDSEYQSALQKSRAEHPGLRVLCEYIDEYRTSQPADTKLSGAPDIVSFVIGDSLAGATGHLIIGAILRPSLGAVGGVVGKSLARRA
jgi:hypothetical protein